MSAYPDGVHMPFDFAVGVGRRCTLYSRSEYRSRFPSGTPGEKAGKELVGAAGVGDLARDTAQLARLRDFLEDCRVGHYAQSIEPQQLLPALQRAMSGGDVIAIVEQLRSSGVSSRGTDQPPRPRSITFSPSQLFKRAAGAATSLDTSNRAVRKLSVNDGIAIWFAKPGDMLPDGTIATALGSAQPFEYVPDDLTGDVMEMAGADRGRMYACDVISAECKGSVLRVFPSQYLNATLNDIQSDARGGVKDARKALKLLNDNRFKK
ncbi:hypothetical protein [Burkholderia sp. RF4-BP95]|uniref:hypothetical protein n=1 Tax=Burkholderia sp. RF4-BP95 TaxID=1637845 RepID=UPI0012E339A0|nr:hypothetical protein [Burkholderia sp. RF4-BP95]